MVTDSYARGNVSSTANYVGGLIGRGNNTVTNAYTTGTVGSGYPVAYTGGTYTNVYWDTTTSGLTTSPYGEGKTTDEMYLQETYTGFNFSDDWTINEGNDYPTLQ